jgi:hypothetical protein
MSDFAVRMFTTPRKYDGQINNEIIVRPRPTIAIAVTALLAPHQTANPPTNKAPIGPVPIDAASTPSTRPRISVGVEVITIMLCIVANPDIEKPPIRRIGSAIQKDGANENASIASRNSTDPIE